MRLNDDSTPKKDQPDEKILGSAFVKGLPENVANVQFIKMGVPLELPQIIRQKESGKLYISLEGLENLARQTTMVYAMSKVFLSASGLLPEIEIKDTEDEARARANIKNLGDVMNLLTLGFVAVASGATKIAPPPPGDMTACIVAAKMTLPVKDLMSGVEIEVVDWKPGTEGMPKPKDPTTPDSPGVN